MSDNPPLRPGFKREQGPLEGHPSRRLGRRWQPTFGLEIAAGTAAALLAVAIRYSLPLSPLQLPVLTVVVAVALTTTFVGLASGIATALVGGLLSWYVFFTPFSWDITPEGFIPLLGFFVTASVIVTTAHLYRLGEQRWHRAELAAVQKEAETAELFARELAHRLKNTLAIVQSIAFRTFGNSTAESNNFAGRLRALGDVHDLLSEHVERPTASVDEVVKAALLPFGENQEQVIVDCSDTTLDASHAVSLALAIHELSTNAVKYGAWSNATGQISVKIEEAGDCIRLVWEEQGGPQVQSPNAQGFGMKLLKSVGSDVEVTFRPDGFRCSLILPKT